MAIPLPLPLVTVLVAETAFDLRQRLSVKGYSPWGALVRLLDVWKE